MKRSVADIILLSLATSRRLFVALCRFFWLTARFFWLTALCSVFYLLFAGTEFGLAQSSAGFSDGQSPSEATNSNYGRESSLVNALPVELVEEQDLPADIFDAPRPTRVLAEEALQGDQHISIDDLGQQRQEETSVAARKEETTTVLNVKDADVTALIKTFSKVTGRNYIVDSSVKGKVTIHLPTPVSISESLRIFDSVLLLKGFTTVPVGDNIWKVVKTKDAKQTTIPTFEVAPDKPSDTIVTQIVRLKHVPADEMQKVISQFVTPDGLVNSFEGTNSLILIGSAANISRLRALVDKLDVPALDRDITIIPINHAEAKDIAEKVNEIMGDESEGDTSTRTSTPRTRTVVRTRRRMPNANDAASTVGQKRRLPLKVIADERTNSLIVVADPETTGKVQALVEQLDSSVDRSSGRFYVYRVRHADAEELSEILNSLISGSTESSSSSNSGSSGGSSFSRRSNQPATRTNNNQSQQIMNLNRRLNAAIRNQQNRTGATGTGRVSFEDEVFIAPDPATNALIINASRTDYQRLVEVIEQLDVKRRQVLVEATLLEVSLEDAQGFGIELQGSGGNDDGGILGQTNFGGITDLFTNPAALSDLTLAAASTGTLTLPGGIVIPSQAILINALSQHTNVNILSTPTIVATDNEEAEIIVGENVPFVTSTGTDPTNLNNTFNQIERQDVGITLRITPQIATGDFINLDIFVEISGVVGGTRGDPNGPTTTIRTTDTRVEVKNGQMIITGGLISDSVNETSQGVPFFEDIPLLGYLFKREDTIRTRNNLLVFITPKVINDQFDAREQTLYESEEFIDFQGEKPLEPTLKRALRNDNVDNVVSELDSDIEIAPTPVTPPLTPKPNLSPKEEQAFNRTNKRLEMLARSASPDGVVDIVVSPKLPTVEANNTPKTRAKTTENTSEQAPRSYVVLRKIRGDNQSLKPADDSGTLGLIVLGKPDFFQVGRRYSFAEDTEYVCLGLFSSTSQAATIHGGLKDKESWNYLSPRDALNLGRGPWRQSS